MGTVANLLAKVAGIGNARYVKRFVPVEEKLSVVNYDTLSAEQKKTIASLEQTIEQFEKMAEQYPLIKEMEEHLVLVIKDLHDFTVSVRINNGTGTVKPGYSSRFKPSFILPLYQKNIENLVTVTADKEIDIKEAYRFIRVLFIPFLKGLYQAEYAHLPKDKSYMQLDNFLQVEVKDESNIKVDGFPGPARATVVNVDGQWLVFEGFQGDPDVRYSMNTQQALEFAYLIRIKLIKASKTAGLQELMPSIHRYNQLKKEVVSYERDWHNVEDLG